MFTDRQLAEAALLARIVTLDDLRIVIPTAHAAKTSLTAALLNHGISEEQIAYLHSALYELPFARIDCLRPASDAAMALPPHLRNRYCVFPLVITAERRLLVAMDPIASDTLPKKIGKETNFRIAPVGASVHAIQIANRTSEILRCDLPVAKETDYLGPARPQLLKKLLRSRIDRMAA